MLRRLVYHSFWNFYDHLIIYLLVGIAQALASLGIAIVGLDSITGGSLISSWSLLIAFWIPVIVALSAMLPFSARVAKGEPVRWSALWSGLRQNVLRVAIFSIAALGSVALLLLNLRFYLLMQDKSNPYIFTILAALDGWLIMLIFYMFWPFMCALSLPDKIVKIREIAYKALVWIVLLPSLWLFVGAAGGVLLWAAFLSRFGLLIYLPVMVVLAQTAAFLSEQYVEFLGTARDEMKPGNSIGKLKKRAREMADEWEARQPRRTFKELVKPWEY